MKLIRPTLIRMSHYHPLIALFVITPINLCILAAFLAVWFVQVILLICTGLVTGTVNLACKGGEEVAAYRREERVEAEADPEPVPDGPLYEVGRGYQAGARRSGSPSTARAAGYRAGRLLAGRVSDARR